MVVLKLIFITFFALIATVIVVLALGGWLISRAAGRASRMISGFVGTGGMPNRYRYNGYVGTSSTAAMLRCPQPRCHAENQPGAKFCRRCGVAMNGQPAAQRVNVRRRVSPASSAVW